MFIIQTQILILDVNLKEYKKDAIYVDIFNLTVKKDCIVFKA